MVRKYFLPVWCAVFALSIGVWFFLFMNHLVTEKDKQDYYMNEKGTKQDIISGIK